MKGGGALDFDGDALLALDDDDAEDALKTDDGDALDVSFDALDMNMDAYGLGVPRRCLHTMRRLQEEALRTDVTEMLRAGR
jgi:hypothetical protein